MKIVLYSPYFPDHFGGGEKYFLDAALVWSQAGHQVSIALDNRQRDYGQIKKNYQQFLGCSLGKIEFIPSPLKDGSVLTKLCWSKQFDVLYYLTDGSAFLSAAKKNLMHIQTPLLLPAKKSWEKFKFSRFHLINANSSFTKTIVERSWGIKVDLVCHPGVSLSSSSKPLGKKPLILHVGRFFRHQHSKRQDVLIDIFQQLNKLHPSLSRAWELVMIGKVEDEEYFRKLQQQAGSSKIKFITNAKRTLLEKYYCQAAIYWHATGFGVDASKHPEKMEHFGISSVEAMLAGAVPVVLAKAGQKEILGKELATLGWQTKEECLQLTAKLMKNSSWRRELSLKAQERASHFSPAEFAKKHLQMIER